MWLQNIATRYINQHIGTHDFLALHLRPQTDICFKVSEGFCRLLIEVTKTASASPLLCFPSCFLLFMYPQLGVLFTAPRYAL